jgi:hypothetical protein
MAQRQSIAQAQLDAVIEDPALGAKAEAMFLDDLEHSMEITMRSRKVGKEDRV